MGKPNVGQKAPLFKLESYNSDIIDLQALLESQKIVIIFSRYFGCPICQLDLKTLLENVDKITSKGAKLLYITQSSKEKALKFIEEKKIGFPVIPSSKEALYKEYGLSMMGLSAVTQIPGKLKAAKATGIEHGENEGWEQQSPGQFVLSADGTIIHMKKGWLDIESILENL